MLTKQLQKMEVTKGFIRIPNRVKTELIGNDIPPFYTKLNGLPARIDKYNRLWSGYLRNRFENKSVVTLSKNKEGFQITSQSGILPKS